MMGTRTPKANEDVAPNLQVLGKRMKSQGLESFLGVALAIVFLTSAIPKLRNPRSFILIVLEYRILPVGLGRLYAHLLPPLELFLSLALLVGLVTRLTSVLALLLIASFMIGITINLARGRRIPCGCFGRKHQREIGWRNLVEDVILLVATWALLWTTSTWTGSPSFSVFDFAVPQSLNSSVAESVGVAIVLLVTLTVWIMALCIPPYASLSIAGWRLHLARHGTVMNRPTVVVRLFQDAQVEPTDTQCTPQEHGARRSVPATEGFHG